MQVSYRLVSCRRVDDNAYRALKLRVQGEVDDSVPLCQSAADSDKDRHIRRHHDGLGYYGLRGERIDCDNSVCVSVSDNARVGRKKHGLYPSAEYFDSAAAINRLGNLEHEVSETPLDLRYVLLRHNINPFSPIRPPRRKILH